MCGRFVLQTDLAEISERFQIQEVACAYRPRDNIRPGEAVAAVIRRGVNRLVAFRWGLIPSWAKNPPGSRHLINARAETVAVKPSFRNSFQSRRCLIVADGFYEWQRTGGRKTMPWFIHLLSGAPCGFAGLFDVWRSPAGEEIRTCAIITTRANELVAPIHERMPVIVSESDSDLWLDKDVRDPDRLLALLRPYPVEEMACRIRHPAPRPRPLDIFDGDATADGASARE
ncbi:MAG: SOS response-associated peptidase [Pseudomonadota bacterium]|nr:SOS response-associated peptidase [Pseudomonadota bacterium]